MEHMDSIPFFRIALLSWFSEHQRKLPWRSDYQPYHVWISEIMGQQTQMERVVQYFNNWINLFPDIRSVASAPEQPILYESPDSQSVQLTSAAISQDRSERVA